MDMITLSKKILLIISILVVVVFGALTCFFIFTKNKLNTITKINDNLQEQNMLLIAKSKQDSTVNKLTNESNEKKVIIKYIEKRIKYDSIIFFNGSVSERERLFSKYTENY